MAVPRLDSKLGGSKRTWRWNGRKVFVAEAGTGPLVLLVHGVYAGSSSYEFRKLYPLLAQRHRVVAMDLLGCGLSDRPKLTYSPDIFAQQIADAIDEFGRPAAVIASSLGAAFTVRAVAQKSLDVGTLVLTCPTGLAGVLDGQRTRFQASLTNLIMAPGIGEVLFNGLASRPSLKWFLETQAYADPQSATPEVIENYWIATHQSGSRYVPAHFVGGALNCPIGMDLPRIDAPVLILWGERAGNTSPVKTAPQYAELARRGELTTFDRSKLLPHEEEPNACAERIECFLAAHP
jgi:pimeloyl-ACP methyl ester carboxylesterase